jgi:hypothetical protein
MAKIRKKRVLPFDGKILVKEGERVESDTIIAEMFYLGERPFIVDIAGRLNIDLKEIEGYLTKKIGDYIEVRDTIAVRHRMAVRLEAHSPVSGILESISPASGNIVIREKVNKEEIGPVTINCAEELNIPTKSLQLYLKKKLGNKVEKGGVIASKSIYAGIRMEYCRSPIFGEIVSIDLKTGNVTVRRPIEERKMDAFIPGVIKEIIPKRGAIIETEGELINGVFGFGGEEYGTLGEEIIILESPLRRKQFEEYKGKIKGIITPSINVREFGDLFGEEIKKGITKDNDTGITIILMKGFGEKKLDIEIIKKYNEFKGRLIAIDGRTQIRAGAKRPEIIIPL